MSESSTTALALRANTALGRIAGEIDDIRELDDEDLRAIVFPETHWSTVAMAVLAMAGLVVGLTSLASGASPATVILTCLATIAAEIVAGTAAERSARAGLARELGVSVSLIDRVRRAARRAALTSRPLVSRQRLRAELLPKIRALLTAAAPPTTEDR